MLVEKKAIDEVVVLRMNNARENRFTRDFVDALNSALDDIENDDSARAVVITGGDEKYFANGLDIEWILRLPEEDVTPFLTDVNWLLHRLFVYPSPVVAAMNGHTFASGLAFALMADYRVMREDRGWCCFTEIGLRIDFPPGSVAVISHVIGHRNTDLAFQTARRFTGPEALELGMVDELTPLDRVLPRAIEVAKELGAKPPDMYADYKKTLRAEAAKIMAEQDEKFIIDAVKDKLAGYKNQSQME